VTHPLYNGVPKCGHHQENSSFPFKMVNQNFQCGAKLITEVESRSLTCHVDWWGDTAPEVNVFNRISYAKWQNGVVWGSLFSTQFGDSVPALPGGTTSPTSLFWLGQQVGTHWGLLVRTPQLVVLASCCLMPTRIPSKGYISHVVLS
jgi:hypothetical protein